MQKKVDFEDFSKILMPSEPILSPDASKVVFTLSKPSLDENDYISRLWIADLKSNEVYSFTNGPKDGRPAWSPSGKYIAFTSRRTLKKEEPGSEIWIGRLDGGEFRMVLKHKLPIFKVDWINDNKLIFLGSFGTIQEDIKIIDRINFWFNGRGFIHTLRNHIFIVDILSEDVKQLTSGDFDINFMALNHSRDKIAYIATLNDLKPYINDIFIYDLKTGESKRLTLSNMSINYLSWSPDDSKIVFRGHNLPRGSVSHNKLYIIDLNTLNIEKLTEKFTLNISNSLNSDVRGGEVNVGPKWVDDAIYFIAHNGGSTGIYSVNVEDKSIKPVINGYRSIESFDVARRGSENLIVFISMTDTEPKELYLFHNNSEIKITNFNSEFLRNYTISKPEYFQFNASDGVKIDGWIMKPVDFDPNKKYPAILYIHGGPKTAYGASFIHEFQVYAAKGYVVIYTNPRGSDGYSEEFSDIRGHYGERDYMDIMEALDYVLANYSFIDSSRIGVAGGSYGGFMTNWIVTHTNRFKAAVSMRGISNWISFYGTSDIGYRFALDHILGDLTAKPMAPESVKMFLEKSPLIYAENVNTPILILHSLEDYRCHYVEALQFFIALKHFEKNVEMVLVPGENHDLSRTGKPKHRVERLKIIVEWFDRYLKQ
ncbi:MAG: S9 family peptidase [Candidatus Methanomethylicia archaeon]